MQTCQVRKLNGAQCKGFARPNGYCFAHDPAMQAKRAEAVSRGGKHSAKSYRLVRSLPNELADIPARLREWLERIEEGKAYPRDCEAYCAVVTTLLAILKFADERTAQRELEERLAAVEQALGEGRPYAAAQLR